MPRVLTPTTTVLSLALANTGYAITLPAGCKHFSLQCRSAAAVRIGTSQAVVAAGDADGAYTTIKSGDAYNSPEDSTFPPGAVLYAANSAGGVYLEIIAWR